MRDGEASVDHSVVGGVVYRALLPKTECATGFLCFAANGRDAVALGLSLGGRGLLARLFELVAGASTLLAVGFEQPKFRQCIEVTAGSVV